MKLSDVEILHSGIIRAQNIQRPLPTKFSYALAKNAAVLRRALETAEKERMKLIREYAVKGEDGKLKVENKQFVMTDQIAFEDAIAKLREQEVGVDLHKIKLSSFPAEIEPGIAIALEGLIEDDSAQHSASID